MMVSTLADPAMRLSLVDKILLLAALAITAALFLTVGWMAIAPDDPRGAVSLITRSDSSFMVLQAGLLAAVTAALATVMVGTKLPDVGVLATAIGFALVSLQGETAAYLLISVTGGDAGAERALAAKLVIETGIWFAMLLIAMIVAGVVTRWCGGALQRATGLGEHDATSTSLDSLAISECPVLSRFFTGQASRTIVTDDRWNGVRTTALMVAAGLVLYSVLVSGSSPYNIQHGQTCFAVFAAFYVGGWVARRRFPARTAFWGMLAVPITLVLGYGWTMIAGRTGGRYAHLANIPGSDFLRALPITFISVGTVAALLAHWFIQPGVVGTGGEAIPASRQRTGRRDGA